MKILSKNHLKRMTLEQMMQRDKKWKKKHWNNYRHRLEGAICAFLGVEIPKFPKEKK